MATATDIPEIAADARLDGMLLGEVAAGSSQESFQTLLRRHSAMVLGVCRRQLGDGHDAEDAAQAVFLVLWRKAARLRGRTSVAGWLHRTAKNVCHTALRAKRARQQRERKAATVGDQTEATGGDWLEIKELLDAELDRLPQKYRLPIILFHLEGHSQEEIAALLNTRRATIATRLARGRELLRKRLVRQGVTITLVGLAAVLTANTCSAAAPVGFVTSTTQAATLFAAGNLAAGGILSAKTAALANGAIQMMTIAKVKTAAVVLVTATAVTGGTAAVVHQIAQADNNQQATPATTAVKFHDSKLDLTPKNFKQIHSLVAPTEDEWRHLRVNWITDIVAARKQAAAEDKPILIRRGGGAGYTDTFGFC